MLKKIAVGACLLTMAASMFAAEGKVLNVYCWNTEFQERVEGVFGTSKEIDGVKLNFIVNPNEGLNYQNKLDAALKNQKKAKADEKVDIFLVEADYALKYVDSAYAMDVAKVGLTKADLADQYKYTQDIMTDSKGKLKGVSWQGCPGGYVYRRSFAKAVLGSDDPAVVQEAVSSWAKFDETAAKMKAAGYYMLSGYDDSFRAFSDNVTSPWVKGNKIVIDDQIKAWIKQTKEYTDKGYNNKASLWSAESTQGMGVDGKVFGYFGPAWFINFCMDMSTSGDWAFCEGPQGFSWGGTWICAAEGTDNLQLVKKIMKTITCDKEAAKTIVKKYDDFANNKKAMEELSAAGYTSAFLGGQNPLPMFMKNAAKINKSTMTQYDQACNESIQNAFKDYFEGVISEEQAYENFYKLVMEAYPKLKK